MTVAVSATVDAAVTCDSSGCEADPAKLSLTGVQVGQAIVAIIAVLAISNEYSTGMIKVTLTAMPRRLEVLAAKAALVAGLVLAAAAVAVLASVLAARLILPGHGFTAAHGYPPLSLANGPVLRAACGSVLYLALIALLSLGVATAVRETAVAIGLVLGLLYVFPVVASVIGNQHWHRHLEQIGPMTAGLTSRPRSTPEPAAHPLAGPRRARPVGRRSAHPRRPGAPLPRRLNSFTSAGEPIRGRVKLRLLKLCLRPVSESSGSTKDWTNCLTRSLNCVPIHRPDRPSANTSRGFAAAPVVWPGHRGQEEPGPIGGGTMPRAQIKDEKTYRKLREHGESKEKSARIANAAANTSISQVGRRAARAARTTTGPSRTWSGGPRRSVSRAAPR